MHTDPNREQAPESREGGVQPIPRQDANRLAYLFFGFLYLGVLALILFMAWPFLNAIIFGFIIAGSFYPLLDFFKQRLRMGRKAATALVTLVILLCVFLPVVYIVVRIAEEITSLVQYFRAVVTVESVEAFLFAPGWAADAGERIFEFLNLGEYNPQNMVVLLREIPRLITESGVLGKAQDILASTAGYSFSLLFQITIMLLVIVATFLEGPRLKQFLFDLSPLPEDDNRLLFDRFNQMNYVTLVCNGVGGVLQGGLAAIGFWMADIPSVMLWFVLMTILAFIPLVGISFVYWPACLYLLATGQYLAALLLFVWCSVVALVVENWFKPIFMGSSIQINSFLVLFSIFGGMAVFGAVGIFYGPLIIIIFFTIVELYHKKYASIINEA